MMLVIGVSALIVLSLAFGWRIGLGFLVGAGVAYLNFYWLKKIVAGLGDLVNASGTVARHGVVRRFMLRFFLMALVAFAILTVSRESLYGFFAGLFLPVAAILCEAVYEVYAALIRGI
ncbi:MAG TPA: ATP synthase subunit I [Terriglobales bacterium]